MSLDATFDPPPIPEFYCFTGMRSAATFAKPAGGIFMWAANGPWAVNLGFSPAITPPITECLLSGDWLLRFTSTRSSWEILQQASVKLFKQ